MMELLEAEVRLKVKPLVMLQLLALGGARLRMGTPLTRRESFCRYSHFAASPSVGHLVHPTALCSCRNVVFSLLVTALLLQLVHYSRSPAQGKETFLKYLSYYQVSSITTSLGGCLGELQSPVSVPPPSNIRAVWPKSDFFLKTTQSTAPGSFWMASQHWFQNRS